MSETTMESCSAPKTALEEYYRRRRPHESGWPRWVISCAAGVVAILDDGETEKEYEDLDHLRQALGISEHEFSLRYEKLDEPDDFPKFRLVLAAIDGSSWSGMSPPQYSFTQALQLVSAMYQTHTLDFAALAEQGVEIRILDERSGQLRSDKFISPASGTKEIVYEIKAHVRELRPDLPRYYVETGYLAVEVQAPHEELMKPQLELLLVGRGLGRGDLAVLDSPEQISWEELPEYEIVLMGPSPEETCAVAGGFRSFLHAALISVQLTFRDNMTYGVREVGCGPALELLPELFYQETIEWRLNTFRTASIAGKGSA